MAGKGRKGQRGAGPHLELDYRAPGPVALQFIRSNARVKAIMGPVGSGKTRAMMVDGVGRAMKQPASPVNGLRLYRTTSVRHTYRQLWRSTIESWHKLVPPDFGQWEGGVDQPAKHTISFPHPSGDGTRYVYERLFIALGDKSIEEACRGFETSDWELDELDTLPDEVLAYCVSRAGRYPDRKHGGPWWHGVRAATNAFDLDSAAYELLIENRPPEWAFFRQPGGLEPGAENLENLPPTYYQDMIVGNTEYFVRKFVHNKFGYSRDGKPVYPEFQDHLHVAPEPLLPLPGLPLLIGADAGLTPAAIICQHAPDGRWLILDELIVEGGAKTFALALNQLLAEPRYREHLAKIVGAMGSYAARMAKSAGPRPAWGNAIQAYADPAAGARVATDEQTWLDVASVETGITFRPAPSNALTLRLEAVRQPLGRLIDGRPGLVLSPTCRVLRRGFNSRYRFKKVFVSGSEVRYVDTPEKNEASHPHDGLQYVLLGGGEYLEVRGRTQSRNRPQWNSQGGAYAKT